MSNVKSETIPVMLELDRKTYEEYKKLGKLSGFVPKAKLTENANAMMKRQVSKG